MRPRLAFLLFVSTVASGAFAQTKKADPVGYIYCASGNAEQSVPVFLEPCMKLRFGNFSCGQKIRVVAQLGSALKVTTSGGMIRFVNNGAVSQRADELIPIEIEAGPAPECKGAEQNPTENRAPRVVFQRDPDYPEHPRRSRDARTVTLGLVVGVDGRPRDIKVEASPDKDFAKNAVDAVKQWRFEPAIKDGKPIDEPIHVEVNFRVIY